MEYTQIKIKKEYRDKLAKLAASHNRSMANMVEVLIDGALVGTDLHPSTAARIDYPGKRGHENIHGTPCGDPACKLHVGSEPVRTEPEETA